MNKQHEKTKNARTMFYKGNYDHIQDELRKLDLLIQLRVMTFRQKIQAIQNTIVSNHMFISHEEVDLLLRKDSSFEAVHPDLERIRSQLKVFQNQINANVAQSLEHGVFLALPHLTHIFTLSPFELQVLVICLAPELYRKYDKLYAYLQDDITRKKPSVDLVLNLLCENENDRWKARTIFSNHAPLFRFNILDITDDLQNPSGSSDLSRFLKLDPRIMNYILGNNSIDEHLIDITELYRPLPSTNGSLQDPSLKTKLLNLIKRHFSIQKVDNKPLVLYMYGPYGVGKRELAQEICNALNHRMLCFDIELILAHEADLETTLKLVFREGLLLQSPLYIENVDVLMKDDNKAKPLLKKLAKLITEYGWFVFLSGEKPLAVKGCFEHVTFHDFELPVPDVPLREMAWESVLKGLRLNTELTWAKPLSRQFRLTQRQIRDAARFVEVHNSLNAGEDKITLLDFYSACRKQSNHKLHDLAIKIASHYSWDDIILPEEKLTQLKEICSQVKHSYLVFKDWGFDQKISHGKGLSILFSGPSGTGKTMASEIIAHELQLDLYKIDLSSVVSKYIGETEKNLAAIFREAETSNAILLFDEADALFGKRTEVSDAHDRYANIETSYLLQKMEEYEGVVILATNLRENMDEAFTRRIRFIVEFPFPDEQSRLRIWKVHFPKEAPLSNNIDYKFLSKHFKIAGGNIKNIALNAAFFAAEDGNIISMKHILHGAKREFEKIGKLWDESNLNQSLSIHV